jgi:DNA polymerase-3 subunit alpha
MFSEVRETYPRKGPNRDKKMALVRIEDFEGSVGGVMFCDQYSKYGEHVEAESLAFVEATLDKEREEPSLKIDRVFPLDRAFQELAGSVTLRIGADAATPIVTALKGILEQFPGNCPVFLEVSPLPSVRTLWKLPATSFVMATPNFVNAVEQLLGEGSVTFSKSSAGATNGNGTKANRSAYAR